MTAAAESAAIEHSAVAGDAAVYRRLLGYSARYWPIAIVAMIGMVFDAACGAAFTWQIKPMLDGLFRDKDAATMFWMPVCSVYSAIWSRSGPRMFAEIAKPPAPSPLPSAFLDEIDGR